jgi:antitoxin (DNA-binding transcriptional repressor) of toxin-antitoxin stability system
VAKLVPLEERAAKKRMESRLTSVMSRVPPWEAMSRPPASLRSVGEAADAGVVDEGG